MNKIELKAMRELIEERKLLADQSAEARLQAYQSSQEATRLSRQLAGKDEAIAVLQGTLRDEQANVERCARELNQAQEENGRIGDERDEARAALSRRIEESDGLALELAAARKRISELEVVARARAGARRQASAEPKAGKCS